MDKYKLLISGCGTAGTHVARVAVEDSRAEVAGVFDPRQEAMAALLAEFPTAVAGHELESLLDDVQPDVVAIAGPDHLHASQAIAAAEHGCHLLIEKPLAVTVEEAREIMAAVEHNGVIAMTDQTMRYVYPYRQMADMARAGDVGRIFFIQGDYVHDMWSYYSPKGHDYTPWRSDKNHPQNILLGGGCHPIDLMLWTVGSPVREVMCYSSKLSVPEFPSDDCYLVSLRFENGVIGKVTVSSGCSGHGMGEFLEIFGTEGTLSKGELRRRDADSVTIPAPTNDTVVGGHGWGGSVTDFLDTLDGKIANPIPLSEGAKTIAMCEAALESSRDGHPVVVSQV
jgi:UDP-N-acetyl-2-amino-2-deoxyglucuronate dehydrogenase